MRFLADSNIWLALSVPPHTFHETVTAWYNTVPDGDELVFCRLTQQALLRLLTTEQVTSRYGWAPLSNADALALYSRMSSTRHTSFAHEPPDIEVAWRRLATRSSNSPKLWMDAYLAAFAITGQFSFVTTDAAFTQFTELDLVLLR